MADLKSGAHAPLQAHRPCCAAWPMPSPRIRGPLLSSQRQEPCGPRLEPRVVLVSSCRGERVRHRRWGQHGRQPLRRKGSGADSRL